MVGFHLNARHDSSWLIRKLGQAYGEWDIDLAVLINRESDFSTSDSHSDWKLVQFYLHWLTISLAYNHIILSLISSSDTVSWYAPCLMTDQKQY